MKIVEKNNRKIEFYDSSKEIGFKRYHAINKYLMVASAVGSTFQDYDKRESAVIKYLGKKMYEEALQELENRRQCVFNVFSLYNPKHYVLALLVKSIDGHVFGDFSESGLNVVLNELDNIGITEMEFNDIVDEIKKK